MPFHAFLPVILTVTSAPRCHDGIGGEAFFLRFFGSSSNTVSSSTIFGFRIQNSQLLAQCEQNAFVTGVIFARPVANNDRPLVKMAAVAFPPLIPCLTVSLLVVTKPLVWQCGQTRTSAARFGIGGVG